MTLPPLTIIIPDDDIDVRQPSPPKIQKKLFFEMEEFSETDDSEPDELDSTDKEEENESNPFSVKKLISTEPTSVPPKSQKILVRTGNPAIFREKLVSNFRNSKK